MKIKNIIIITFLVVLGLFFNHKDVQAFQPVSHYVLIEKTAKDLPQGSKIRQAVETYPNIAAWGSIGPDLGYFQVRELGGYAPWADRYHYYKVGSYAKQQLQDALQSNDLKKIAFAAGWVSHVSGDLACHGIYVNPECGVYLDNTEGRDLHKEMENNAEAFAWVDIGGHLVSDYNSSFIPNKFGSVDDIPYDLMNNTALKIYGSSSNTSDEKLWANTLITGLKTSVGYTYVNYNDSRDFLITLDREKRLRDAFSTAEKQCGELLALAEAGDYSKFSDRWNLDVGASNSPISSLTTIIETGKDFGSGTDDDIYFGIQLVNGDNKEWPLDKSYYNDFESGDNDEYYLYMNDLEFSPTSVNKVWIRKEGSSLAGKWYFKSIRINVNGKDVLVATPNKWIDQSSNIQYFNSNWSSVTNTSDPVFN